MLDTRYALVHLCVVNNSGRGGGRIRSDNWPVFYAKVFVIDGAGADGKLSHHCSVGVIAMAGGSTRPPIGQRECRKWAHGRPNMARGPERALGREYVSVYACLNLRPPKYSWWLPEEEEEDDTYKAQAAPFSPLGMWWGTEKNILMVGKIFVQKRDAFFYLFYQLLWKINYKQALCRKRYKFKQVFFLFFFFNLN